MSACALCRSAWAFSKASSKICAFWSGVKVEGTCIVAGKSAGVDRDKSPLIAAPPRAIAEVLGGRSGG